MKVHLAGYLAELLRLSGLQGFREENGQKVAFNTMIYSESEVSRTDFNIW